MQEHLMNKRLLITLMLSCWISISFGQFNIDVVKDLNPQNFNTDFSAYHRETAIFCAQLSNIAYENPVFIDSYIETLNEYYPKANFTVKHVIGEKTSSELFILSCNRFVIVAFRGTQETQDFVKDIKFIRHGNTKNANQQIDQLPAGHGGFRGAVIELLNEEHLIDSLRTFQQERNKKLTVFLTGHSLGAATAQFFIKPLMKEFTYGGGYYFAPPIGIDLQTAKVMKTNPEIGFRSYDIINNTDLITRLPYWKLDNYGHLGKFYRICQNDELAIPLIYKEKEMAFKYKFLEKLQPKKALFDKYHRMIYNLEAVKAVQNTEEKILERSNFKGEDCSCLVKGRCL